MKPMVKMVRISLVLLLLASLSFSSSAQMGGLPQFEWGARYLGSLLFTSPLDDAFTSLYNPAHLSFVESSQIASQRKLVFGVPFTAISWAYAPISLGGHLVIQETPEGLGFNYNTYRLALAWSLYGGGFSLGIAPKLYYLAITGINGDITSLGYGVDAGLTYKMGFESFDLYLSLSGEDAYSLLETPKGTKELAAPPKYRAGVTFKGGGLVMGFSIIQKNQEQDFCLGLDYNLLSLWEGTSNLMEELALRGGIREQETGERTYSLGVGVFMRGFRIDYAYLFSTYSTETVLSTSLCF